MEQRVAFSDRCRKIWGVGDAEARPRQKDKQGVNPDEEVFDGFFVSGAVRFVDIRSKP